MKEPNKDGIWSLRQQPPVQLFMLVLIWLVVALASSLLLQTLLKSWGWESFAALLGQLKTEPVDATTVDDLRWLQLVGHLLNYTLVALIFIGWAFGRTALQQLRLDRLPEIRGTVLALALTLVLFPLISWVYYWNTNLIPETWIAQDKLALQRVLLQMENPGDLWLNLLLLGGAAALGEELIFRGILQPILTTWTNNYHLGAWATGALFSLIHFQWEGFVPRLLMGVFFCYVFWYTQNLWIPLLLHSFFNSIQVILPYLYPDAITATVEPRSIALPLVLLSLFLFVVLWYFFEKIKLIRE